MSVASLIHEHSYSYKRQLADGTLQNRHADGAESSSSSRSRKRAKTSSDSSSSDNDSATTSSWTPPSAASYYIPSLPGLDSSSTLTLFGGHIPSTITPNGPVNTDVDGSTTSSSSSSSSAASEDTGGNAHLFFFLAKAKHIAEKEKLVIWLNGGATTSTKDTLDCG